MKYRKLRIVWSVWWGVVCLLLIVLWVRSYRWYDALDWRIAGGRAVAATSHQGHLTLSAVDSSAQAASHAPRFRTRSISMTNLALEDDSWWGLVIQASPLPFITVYFPLWFPLVLSAIFAAVPWLRWRFSLRTLLIGMTVAAIGLGWIVYLIR